MQYVSQHSNCHTKGLTTTEVMSVSQSLDLCNEMSSDTLTVCPGCDDNSDVNHSDRTADLCAITNANKLEFSQSVQPYSRLKVNGHSIQ